MRSVTSCCSSLPCASATRLGTLKRCCVRTLYTSRANSAGQVKSSPSQAHSYGFGLTYTSPPPGIPDLDLPPALRQDPRASRSVKPVKLYKRGSFKAAFYGWNNLPDSRDVYLQLRSVLYPPSSSSSPTRPNPLDVLNAAVPMCTTKMRVYLDKFVNDIVDILGNHYANTPPDQNALPGVQKAVAEVLGVCYIQSAIKRQKNPDSQSQDGTAAKTEETYARYLIHQAVQATGDPGRLQVLLEALERSLEVYQVSGNGFRISIPLTAAWIVLRGKSERTNPPRSRFVWPSMPLLVEYLEKALAKHGETARDYAKGIDVLLKTADKKALPFTPQDLDQQLSSFVADGHENEVVDAWLRYRDHLGAGETKSEPGSIFDPDPDVRRDVLGKFLYYLNAPKFNHRRPSDPDRIERCTREAVQLVPRPIPLSIHHTLVAAWARAFDTESELESGEILVSLDAGPRTSDNSQTMTTKRERTLQKLHATWEAATQDGLTRDVKLYMLFMEGLGQLGDVAGLQKTWNELVDDEACKRRHFEDHDDANGNYPPTRALNHMISALLLIPRRGAVVALELFKQASSPSSSVPCDLVTINTVLRHQARAADVPAMNSLFALAEKLNLKPDVITYTTLVQGLLRANQLQMAKKTLDTMYSEGKEPTERMCSMLIADLAKNGDRTGLRHAEELMREMKKKGFMPDVVTWTGLLSGYFRGGWEEDGWEAVDRMEKGQGIQLNRVAYHVILRQAGEGKLPAGAAPVTPRLFKRMLDDGITPNSDTYVLMLEPLLRAKRFEEARKVLREMKFRKFQPEKSSLINLVKKARFKRAL